MFHKKLFPIYLLTIVNTFGFSILFPILPFILETYHGGAFFYGLILSIYSVFQFFACPFFGSLSDSFGRKKIILLTQAGTFLSWIIFGLALLLPPEYSAFGVSDALLIILIARIFDGITGGNQVVANAYVADVTSPEQRTQAFAGLGVLTGIGLVVGPVLGGVSSLGPRGYLGTALVAAGLSLFTWFVLWKKLPESLPDEKRRYKVGRKQAWKDNNVLKRLEVFMKSKYLSHLFVVIFFFGFVFNGFVTVYLWYVKDVLDANLFWTSAVGALIGVFFALNQGFLLKQLARVFDETKLVFFGLIFLTVGMGLFTKMPQAIGFIFLSFLATLGVSLCMPTFKSLLTQHTDASLQGTIMGVDEALYAFNRIIAPLFAGFVWGISKSALFGLFALLCLIPLVVVYAMIVANRKVERLEKISSLSLKKSL